MTSSIWKRGLRLAKIRCEYEYQIVSATIRQFIKKLIIIRKKLNWFGEEGTCELVGKMKNIKTFQVKS